MKIGLFPRQLLRFIPHQRMYAQQRLPVEFHKGGFPFSIDEAEGVNAEAVHHAVAAREGAIGHDPHHHVHGFRGQRDKIPEVVMRRRRLRHVIIRLGLEGMNEIGKFDGILNEEHRDIIAYEIPDAFGGIKLGGKSPRIPCGVGRAQIAIHK